MMSLTIKKTALAAAVGLSICASPAGAFPFWSFSGFGGSGALGGDNQYAPFSGRYILKDGGMEFIATESLALTVTNGNAPPPITGNLVLHMQLEGRAYDFPDIFPGRDKVEIMDPDGVTANGDEYIALGDFSFEMNFDGAKYESADGADILYVPTSANGRGTLTYDTDVVFDDANGNGIWDSGESDISVDGEKQGDVVFFSTPDCNELSNNSGRSSASCTSNNFFELFSTGGPADAYTPVGAFQAFDGLLGTSIPTSVISLFHAGLPCPPGVHDDNTAEKFYCDPIAANFPLGGIPVPGDPQGRSYETYAEYVAGFNPPGHVAFINVQATPTNVPSPATGLLLGAGLAGLGFARRRARARSEK